MKIHNNHEVQKFNSPFTEAAIIVPLKELNFKPWTKDGFSISSWFRVNSIVPHKNAFDQDQRDLTAQRAFTTINDFEKDKNTNNISSQQCLCKSRQHLISIGSNSMLLSIYICASHVNTMFVHVTNMNAHHYKGSARNHVEMFQSSEASGNAKIKAALSKRRRSTKRDRLTRDNSNKDLIDSPTSSSNVLSATINSTKTALKTGLSHLNLFSSTRNHDKDHEAHVIPIELKGIKIPKNRWTLFVVAARIVDKTIQLEVFVDNSATLQIDVPCSHMFNDIKKDKFSVLCIGHKCTPNKAKECPSNVPTDHIDETDKGLHEFTYSLSNVLLFKQQLFDRETFTNLYALGPDCINFTQCQVNSSNSIRVNNLLN